MLNSGLVKIECNRCIICQWSLHFMTVSKCKGCLLLSSKRHSSLNYMSHNTERCDGKVQSSIGEFAWTDWTNISFVWLSPRLCSALTATEEGVNNPNCATLWAGWPLYPRHMAVFPAACLFTLHQYALGIN